MCSFLLLIRGVLGVGWWGGGGGGGGGVVLFLGTSDGGKEFITHVEPV